MAIPNYTSEQIVDLVVMLHRNNIHFLSSFFYGRGRVCSGDEIYSSKLKSTLVLFSSSPGCDNEITASMVRRVMFLLPLEKMPLLINDLVLGVNRKLGCPTRIPVNIPHSRGGEPPTLLRKMVR